MMTAYRYRLTLGMTVGLLACQRQGDPVGPGSNRAPEVRNVTVSPPSVGAGGTATVRVEAFDPDGDRLFYRYEAELGSLTQDPGDPSVAVYRAGEPGDRGSDRITVSVTDSKNAAVAYRTQVGLQGNQPPQVQVANPGTCHPPCSLPLLAEASDPEGSPLTFVWSGCAAGTGPSAQCQVAALGNAYATVTVSDQRGGVAVATTVARGVNASPVVSGGGDIQSTRQRLLLSVHDPDDSDGPARCAWWGDCTCTGDFQSYNSNCELPAAASACIMIAFCWDRWGGIGETRFRMLR